MGQSGKLVYLAAPYSHPDREVREQRFQRVNKVAARLMAQGLYIYSPISHSHPIAEAGGLPTDWAYWEQYDRAILAVCSRMIVLRQEGWESSRGVQSELAIALEMGLTVEFIDE